MQYLEEPAGTEGRWPHRPPSWTRGIPFAAGGATSPPRRSVGHERGFVLVLTLALLSLLVIASLGIAAAARLSTGIADTSAHRARARENALFALEIALGELERATRTGAECTGMAGIAGVPAGASGLGRRHWCGVWASTSSVPIWLVSGAVSGRTPQLRGGASAVVMVGAKSVGAESANSEHVLAGRESVDSWPLGSSAPKSRGGYAWWIGDEGVKISATVLPEAVPPAVRVLPPSTPSAANSLRTALQSNGGQAARAMMYEQLRFITTPAAPLSNSIIWDNFHSVSLANAYSDGAQLQSGRINLNTTSAPVWRAILEAYNTAPGAKQLTPSRVATIATRLQDGIATAVASGKGALGPFESVTGFVESNVVDSAFTGTGITKDDLNAFLTTLVVTRSDTFRIRGYGDSVLADGSVGGSACCEAIVQRADSGGVSAFRVRFFRWVGTSDV